MKKKAFDWNKSLLPNPLVSQKVVFETFSETVCQVTFEKNSE